VIFRAYGLTWELMDTTRYPRYRTIGNRCAWTSTWRWAS